MNKPLPMKEFLPFLFEEVPDPAEPVKLPFQT
jgi:hypothetical protein